jgi:hypothetical protein
MYSLLVYFPEDVVAHATIPLTRASDVLARIPELLAEHAGCEHVVVYFNDIRLFAVDCSGNTIR